MATEAQPDWEGEGGRGLESRPAWIEQESPETQEALRKAGIWHQAPTLKARIAAWLPDWQKRVQQGLVDQFAPR